MKNKLSSTSYKYHAIPDHPSHRQHKAIRNQYGNAIVKAKQQYWADFLEEAEECKLWIANKYISSPSGDGSKTRIPSLKVKMPDSTTSMVTSNEGKAELLSKQFFPPLPATSTVLADLVLPKFSSVRFLTFLAEPEPEPDIRFSRLAEPGPKPL
jgi:hypothetical protein